MAIKIAGRKTTKTSPAKPAARKSSGNGRKTRSNAAKASPRKASTAAKTMSDGRVRRPTTDDQKVINKHIKILQSVGEDRDETKRAHEAAVQAVYEATQAAMDDGVPTGIITEHSGISRQWLYKMGEHAGRDGNGAAKPARKSTAAKGRGRATASKQSSNRPTIRTRNR